MLKKIFSIFLLIIVLLVNCGDEEYEVDYDEEKINFYYKDKKIILKNNLTIPVILAHRRINNDEMEDKEIENFIKYKVCEYIKYKDEVVVNYEDKLNQIIYLTSIVLPGKSKEIEFICKKDDEVLIEFYPVNYIFLSDNVYFINKNISEKEKRYKLYTDKDIENLNISELGKKEDLKTIDGIMIFVKEYALLDDFHEEIEFEIER